MRTLRLLLILCILPFLSVEAQNSNYYVTPTGAGDGSAWTKSQNAKSFVSKFSDEAYQKDTFHLSEGKYLLNAKEPQPLMTNVKGGYVADDYTVRDPFNNESVISGSVSTKENECVTVQVTAPTEAEITLDGVVLESAAAEPVIVSSAGEGSAVILKGCVLRKAAPNVCEDQVVKIDTTIYLGMAIKELPDAKFEKIGRFTEEVTSEGENGCNLITQYVVSVLPKSDGKLNYYVKQNGTGDGSSWENAMGDTAFAYAFGRVEEGATFHVAEGVYRPIYDKNGEELGSSVGEVSQKVFYSNKTVNIIGGYPADANDKSVPDTLYHTVFSGFIPLGSGHKIGSIMQLEPIKAGLIHISGVHFEDTFAMSSTEAALNIAPQVAGVTFELNSCRLEKLHGSPLVVEDCGGKINMCDFGCEPGSGIDYWVSFSGTSTDALIIENSSLNCDVKVLGNTYTIVNSSIKRITIGSVTGTVVSSKGTIDHSTIDSLLVSPNSECELNGNIVAMVSHAKAVVSGDSNIFIEGEITHVVNVNDKTLSAADFASLFESGVMSMAYNSKSFTRTYALVSDTLPDGTSIRIPRGTILTDQTGKDRALNTCPGAYELAGYTKEIYSDKVLVFSVSEDFPQIGESELIKEEKQDDGNTYNVHYKVNVLPNPAGETLNYYVKQNGTGDGSSWANAMGDTAFAFAFGKVPSGATFHVAEGVYHPVYDKNGKYDFSTNQALMDRVFYTEKLVSVIGGYSNNAEEFPVTDTSYHTIFSAAITESISANGVMRIEPQQSGEVHISGVRFIDTLTSIYKCKDLLSIDPKSNGVTFRLDSCRFTGDAIRLLNVDSCGGKISMCDFVSLGDGKEKSKVDISGLSSDSLIVNNTSLSCQINVGYYPYYIANSTIDKIVFETNSESNVTKGSIENSTILDLTYYPNTEGILQGNIIYSYVKVKAPITLSNNIVVMNDDDVVEDQDNMYVTREEVNSLWGGESPTMTYPDNSFTQTVKLLKDTLPNGKPIRINRTLSLDQIGQTRLDATCPGAYEIGFFQRIIELSDTAMALDSCKFSYVLNASKSALKSWTKSKDGEAYDFAFDLHDAKIPVAGGTERFVKPGDLYVWRDTIKHNESDVMYDTIFVRRISVLPKPSPNFKESNELHYYVKVDGSGNGDGSSWANAMNDTAFAFSFGKVPEGATFHVAEGVYRPYCDTCSVPIRSGTPVICRNFYSDKIVNIIGGYPSDATDESVPDIEHQAILTGDFSDVEMNPSARIIHLVPQTAGTINISGIEFQTTGVTGGSSTEQTALYVETMTLGVKLRLQQCKFAGTTTNAVCTEYCGVEMDSCDVNSPASLKGAGTDSLIVKDCFFKSLTMQMPKSNISNSTIVYLYDYYTFGSQEGINVLTHNTIGTTDLKNTSSNTLVGNIFQSPIVTERVMSSETTKAIDNIFVYDDETEEKAPSIEGNRCLPKSWLKDMFVYEEDHLDPVYRRERGAYTQTMPLKSDVLSDGTSIRIERREILVDQTGFNRFSQACPGAYEYPEYKRKVQLEDTVVYKGNSIATHNGSVISYDKIGYAEWSDKVVYQDGSVDTMFRKVVVMPKAGENLYYYVKQNGDGTGDGSSWSNAMSDSAFAFAFSRVEDGATFHIAEGTYHPIYDENGVDNNHVSDLLTRKEFYTEKLVNIVGGYPATASDDLSVTHDVAQYPTIFDGRVVIEGTQCFGQDVIHISPTQKGKVKISDVIVAGNSCYHPNSTCGALHLTSTEKDVRFVLEKVRFEENKDYALVIDSCKTQISMCDVVGGLVIVRGDEEDSLTVSSSSFSNPVTISTGTYQLTNNTFVGVAEFGKGVLSNKGLLTHNTIKNADFKVGSDCKLKNNIINSLSIQGNPTVTKLSCLNNVMSTSVEDYDATQNIIVSSDEIAAILDEEAKYADGSFTRTIALLKDSVAGQSIRSPRLADVKTDQNGRARYDETCAGAFELPGMVITTQGEDTTIIVHESIDGIAFEQIGVHQHCTTTVKEDESKVVTCRTVTVLPKDDASLHYYVSQHGLGLKDGSSQANAMSDSSFAFSFGKVPSRSTFIIVEGGTYYPYNMDDTLAGGLSPKGFYSDRCVSVKALDGLDDNSLPILSGCLGTEKLDTLVYVKNQASADITEFNRIQFSNSSTANGTINDSKMIFEGSVFQLMSCRFKNFTDSLTIQAIRSRGVLEACDFDMNGKFVTFEGPIMEPTPSIAIKRSSFDCIVYANCFNCSVENSSFYSLETKMIGSKVRLTHNTLRKLIITAGNLEVSANLIEDITEKPEFKECNDVMASHENLFGTVGFLTIDIDPSDTVSTGLFGQLTKLDAMAYQGNFTKSYMMIRDTLSDGSSIRVNRESSMSKDQYGKNRYPMTCRGAIELDGYTQHRTLYDTILVHDTYYLDNVRYDEVGYKVINAKALNSYGGEDPITAYLTVLPKNGTGKISAPYHYYVKQNGSGNKDGSSWQNAMSDTTFAEIFGRVRNNSTFHVAAGVYHPVYDQSLALASASDTAIATFYTDRWVNIVGGYDANVTDISAVPNPKGERTIFTRAVAGEDVSAESDSIAVITYAPSVARTFSISGVTISGGTSLQIKAQKSGVMFQVENTLMKYGVGVKADKLDSLYLNAVTFDSCQTGVAAGELSYLKAVNSTFAADPNALDGELAISLPSIFNGRCVLTHNTLLAPVSVSGGSYYWTGNIFAGGVVACDGSKQGKVDSKYNLYPENASVAQSYDIQNSLTAMEELFGGTWDLDYALGFTPVLPLASDVLNNGRSIRFKREVSNLIVDQIGESRLFLTCMGAYEYANVTELTIPTAFTPYTKDGINDIFMFGYPVFIYDRYGRLIANSDNGWDGKYRGEDADAGVYVYVLWDANGKQYKGTVEILKQK
ncbi:MAG: gliding motility-associated C-terminal domain-containing protein [Paludibacteraceae bacterium]|nr:gliding motility-associated C-terminal domain-containing protein [Paludibacteraceae bacterium]